MYFENAIERINKINWNKLGNPASQNEKNLGYEYLKRMAHFFYNQNLKPMNPLFTNIASLLGDKEIMNIMEYCNVDAQERLEDKSTMEASLTFCLQFFYDIDVVFSQIEDRLTNNEDLVGGELFPEVEEGKVKAYNL